MVMRDGGPYAEYEVDGRGEAHLKGKKRQT